MAGDSQTGQSAIHLGRSLRQTADASKSPPTVLVAPTDHYFSCLNVLPPLLEFFTGNVKRCGRHQVIKDDAMLLTPIEAGDKVHVVVIKKVPRDRSADLTPVQRTIDQL